MTLAITPLNAEQRHDLIELIFDDRHDESIHHKTSQVPVEH